MAKQKSAGVHTINLGLLAFAAAASTVAHGNLLKPQCGPDEIHLEAHVREPGCYPLLHLNEVCVDKKQCIDEHTFCGHHHLSENLTEPTVCVCNDDTKEVHGRCVIRHHCCLSGYNPDHLQANCPKQSMFCAYNRCLCRPGYKNDRTVEDCVPEEEEGVQPEVEKVGTIDGPKWEQCKKSSSGTNLTSWIIDHHRAVIGTCFAVTLILSFVFYKLFKKHCSKYKNVPQKDPAQQQNEA